jgi:two-component system chemotaxis sensor kinase CheA
LILIKGTCGFLGYSKLEAITHVAENILSQLRNGERDLTPPLVSLLLETIDAIKQVLRSLEATGEEGEDESTELRERLRVACEGEAAPAAETPQTPAPVEEMAGTSAPTVADFTIRVAVGLLDKLMNLVGELVRARNQILPFNARHEDAALNANSQRLDLITTELQESVMKTRMQPIRGGLEQVAALGAGRGGVLPEADHARNGRRRHRHRPHHPGGHQGSVDAQDAELLRSRHRDAGGAGTGG